MAVMDMFGGLSSGFSSVTSFFTASLIWSFFKLIGWLLFALVLVNFLTKYRFIVITRTQRGVGQRMGVHFCKKIEENGIVNLKFLLSKTKVPFPNGNYIFPARFFLPMECIEFYVDASGNYAPIKFGFLEGEGFLYPEEQDQKVWHILQTKQNNLTYKSEFWQNYGTMIGIGLCVCLCLITIILTYKQMDKVLAMGNSLLQTMASIKAPPIT